MKGLALINSKSWPAAVKQFNEVMAAGRKPISRDVQTEVLASVHMLPDWRSTVFNLDGKSSGWSQELVIQWYYATFSQRK